MRLINVHTFQLHQFNEATRPPYAILSHTWGDEEPQYADLLAANSIDIEGDAKFAKVRESARLAKVRDQLDYIWIDTCCIDKTSSAELQEAINSMFRWYKHAVVCYAYLGDVESVDADKLLQYSQKDFESVLSACRWVSRGWTLQELLAPQQLEFYAADWSHLASKESVTEALSNATGIPKDCLHGFIPSTTYSVAQRMSWASKRQCTRAEDVAYSLMGIFNVNIPMLYGEGDKAFIRLQQEIINSTHDLSLFAWRDCSGTYLYSGILASSPASFAHCSGFSIPHSGRREESYAMTNLGLRIEAKLKPMEILPEQDIYVWHLNDAVDGYVPVGIFLQRTAPASNQFARALPNLTVDWNHVRKSTQTRMESIYILKQLLHTKPGPPLHPFHGFIDTIRIAKATAGCASFDNRKTVSNCDIARVWPTKLWNSENRSFESINAHPKYGRFFYIWLTLPKQPQIDLQKVACIVYHDKWNKERGIYLCTSLPVDISKKDLESAQNDADDTWGTKDTLTDVAGLGIEEIQASIYPIVLNDRIILDVSIHVEIAAERFLIGKRSKLLEEM
jgi:hypothetical protein